MLNGKVAVVTGGSRGIGAAIAAKLAALGADIAILYVGDPAEAEAACEECRKRGSAKVQAYVCDVSDFEAVKNVADMHDLSLDGVRVIRLPQVQIFDPYSGCSYYYDIQRKTVGIPDWLSGDIRWEPWNGGKTVQDATGSAGR